MVKQETCKERIREHYRGRIADIRDMRAVYGGQKPAHDETTEDSWSEFGLSLDYVSPGTFEGQRVGYLRFAMSTGGPGDEFRFYLRDDDGAYRIEYWFLDWFDGAKITVKEGSKDWDTLAEILDDWRDCGSIEHARIQAAE